MLWNHSTIFLTFDVYFQRTWRLRYHQLVVEPWQARNQSLSSVPRLTHELAPVEVKNKTVKVLYLVPYLILRRDQSHKNKYLAKIDNLNTLINKQFKSLWKWQLAIHKKKSQQNWVLLQYDIYIQRIVDIQRVTLLFVTILGLAISWQWHKNKECVHAYVTARRWRDGV